MILLPSRGRPELVKRFFDACVETKAETYVLLIIDTDDEGYDYKYAYENMGVMVGAIRSIVEKCNDAFYAFPDREFYGVMADDVVPKTQHWDRLLGQACVPNKISWGDDEKKQRPSHPFLGGELVRKLGYVFPPVFEHFYCDTAIHEIAKATGRGVYLPNVKVPHHHFTSGLAEMDKTYRERPKTPKDVFEKWKRTELPLIVSSLSARGESFQRNA